MSDMSIPERPLQPPHDLGPSPEFDPWDDEQMEHLFGKEMAGPIGGLLQLRQSAKTAKKSFGLSENLFTDMVLPELDKLHEAAIEVFRNDL